MRRLIILLVMLSVCAGALQVGRSQANVFFCAIRNPALTPKIENGNIVGYVDTLCRGNTASMTIYACLYAVHGDDSARAACVKPNVVLNDGGRAVVKYPCRSFRGITSQWYVWGWAHIFMLYTLKEISSPKVRSATVELPCAY